MLSKSLYNVIWHIHDSIKVVQVYNLATQTVDAFLQFNDSETEDYDDELDFLCSNHDFNAYNIYIVHTCTSHKS